MIVIDANVAVKWFLPEPLSDAADASLGENAIRIAPEHVLVEVGHVLVIAWRAGKISLADARGAVAALTDLIQCLPTLELIEQAIVIAAEIGCTAYDALHVAAAERYDAALVTADLKLVRQLAAAKRPVRTRILGA